MNKINKLIAWFIITFLPTKPVLGSSHNETTSKWGDMTNKLYPILMFELGNLQVYHFQTKADRALNKPHGEVYWRDKDTYQSFGPFGSIYQAVSHYTFIEEERKVKDFKTKVISVDFQKRKKLGYYV